MAENINYEWYSDLKNSIKTIKNKINSPIRKGKCLVCDCDVCMSEKTKNNHLKSKFHTDRLQALYELLQEKEQEEQEYIDAIDQEEYEQEQEKTLKVVYRKLCLKFHPDKNPNVDVEIIKNINNLYEIKDLEQLQEILVSC